MGTLQLITWIARYTEIQTVYKLLLARVVGVQSGTRTGDAKLVSLAVFDRRGTLQYVVCQRLNILHGSY
jgi:hypothetical protein